MILPSVWGDGGALFAYSGMDGTTDWRYPLVGSTIADGRGFVFHIASRPVLKFGIKIGENEVTGAAGSPFDAVEDQIVAGGVAISDLSVGGARVRLEFVFANAHVVLARATARQAEDTVEVFVECAAEGARAAARETALAQSKDGDHLVLVCSGRSARPDPARGRVSVSLGADGEPVVFAWAFSPDSEDDAFRLASAGLRVDFDAGVDRQLRFFRELPEPRASDPRLARTYYKCASVLKVNCCSPEGNIPVGWTTPDRWPHRNMWIWDSAFHAIGLRHFSGTWAEDAISAVLAVQRDSGFIPHMMTPDSSGDSRIIQPPILAWAAWKVYQTTRNRGFLEYLYPRVGKMLNYDCEARDTDGSGLAEWESGGASGMDNSPRFDQPLGDAVDLNCYIVNDMRHLALIGRELGLDDEAAEWDKRASLIADRINASLWDARTGFYYDRLPNGRLLMIKTEAGFTPLFAGICDCSRAAALVEHLTNPDEFWRPFPISSVAADEPTFSDNMWRGPTWVNFNYFLIDCLGLYGRSDIARELRIRTLEQIARWYEADGLIYEFYDSEGVTDPAFLHRKAHGGPGAVRSAASLGATVCDYNWTAALYIDLLQSSWE